MATGRGFKRSVLGAVSGNVMEFFNFIIYVYLSKYISHHFFPQVDDFLSTFITISVFSSGYLVRPLGALVMGQIGDKIGRKKALMLSIGLISGSTLMIGLTPSYASIGGLATAIIVCCRLLQGFAVSGEESGAAVFLSECSPAHRRGFMGSIIVGSAQTGVLLGAMICFALTQMLSQEQLMHWGWRIPFLLSLPFGLLSYWLRKHDVNHVSDQTIAQYSKSFNPIKHLFKYYKKELFVGTVIVGCPALALYLQNVFLSVYFNRLALEMNHGYLLTNISIFLLCLLIPLMGALSDNFGRQSLYKIGVVGLVTLAPILFFGISLTNIWITGGALFLYTALVAVIAAPMFSLVIDLFPMNVRFTGVSFVFNLAMSLFGSTAPLIALSLHQSYSNLIWVGGYLSVMFLVLWLTVLAQKKLSFQSTQLDDLRA